MSEGTEGEGRREGGEVAGDQVPWAILVTLAFLFQGRWEPWEDIEQRSDIGWGVAKVESWDF